MAPPNVGSTRPPDAAAGSRATSSAEANSCETRNGAAVPFTLFSSLSSRKRLNLRSRSANSPSIACNSDSAAPATMISHPIDSEPVQLQETLVDTSGGASASAITPAARRSRWTILVNRFGAASARALRLCRLGTCARVIPIPPRKVSAASDARAPLARRARRRAAACRLSCTRSGSRPQGKSWAKCRLRSPLRPARR